MFMNRKSIGIIVGLGLAVAAALGTLVLMVRHVPAFYLQTVVTPGKDRQRQATKFASDFAQFYQDVTYNRQWHVHFDESAINSFFDEQLVASGFAEKILPEGISSPRVAIQNDSFRIGFQYRWGPLHTVISIDMRVWLAATELNAVALELRGLHAGALPVAAQSLLERISETARQNNIEVTWFRYEGNPVALLRFQADQDRPTYRLEHIGLKDHDVDVWGRSSDAPLTGGVMAIPTAAKKR